MKNLPLCERQRFLSNTSKKALLKVVVVAMRKGGSMRGQFGAGGGPLGTLQS